MMREEFDEVKLELQMAPALLMLAAAWRGVEVEKVGLLAPSSAGAYDVMAFEAGVIVASGCLCCNGDNFFFTAGEKLHSLTFRKKLDIIY